MGKFVLILMTALAALVPQQSAKFGPRISVTGPHGRVVAPRDTLTYTLRWGKATNATGYKVTVTGSGTPAGTTSGLPSNVTVTDTTITFSASNLTYDSLAFSASVVAVRGTRTNLTPATATWYIVKLPGAPGPIKVDSTAIPPLASIEPVITPSTILVGGTAQACAFFKFSNGTVGMRTQDAPVCSAVYVSRYTLAQRSVNCQTQDWLDGTAVCLTPLARLTKYPRYSLAQ